MNDAARPAGSRKSAPSHSGIFAAFDADGIRAMPSWLAVPLALVILAVAYFGFIAPAFQKRAWSVPPANQLVWRTGALERDGRTGPYLLTDSSGDTLRLLCNPYVGKYINCLEAAGFPVSEDRKLRNVSVGYFVADNHLTQHEYHHGPDLQRDAIRVV